MSGLDLLRSSHVNAKNVKKDSTHAETTTQAPRPIEFSLEQYLKENDFPEQTTDSGVGAKNEVAAKGWDILAYYIPYSIGGEDSWGIYFRLDRIENFVSAVYMDALKLHSGAKLKVVREVIWKAIERHELEHCVQELGYCDAVLSGVALDKDYGTVLNECSDEFEAAATFYEFMDSKFPAGNSSRISAQLSLDILRRQPLPGGYSDWNTNPIEVTESNASQKYAKTAVSLNPLRSLLIEKPRNSTPWLKVPRYRA